MRFALRFWLVAVCLSLALQSVALANVSRGRGRRVLGVVAQAELGRLDGQTAVVGANIYACDSLETDQNGSFRATINQSQIILGPLSYAQLEDEGGNAVQALAISGTIGFSLANGPDFTVRTPAGIIRSASGGPASGQVTYKGPRELLISAMHGDLTLDNGGELRTIPEGKSADVTFPDGIDNSCHEGAGPYDNQPQTSALRRPIGFYIIGGAAAGVAIYFIARQISESPSKTSQ
jgi:hypothetical protein